MKEMNNKKEVYRATKKIKIRDILSNENLWRCISAGILIIGLIVSVRMFVIGIRERSVDQSANNKVYVSSFVVNGIDLGSGYFTMDWDEDEYEFVDATGNERVYADVDSYVEDEYKMEEQSESQGSGIGLIVGSILILMGSSIVVFIIGQHFL